MCSTRFSEVGCFQLGGFFSLVGGSRTPELSRIEQEASRGEGGGGGWRGRRLSASSRSSGTCGLARCGGVSMQAASLIAPQKVQVFFFKNGIFFGGATH